MLIQFTNESTRAAYGATSDRSRLDMREGASRNSDPVQFRAVLPTHPFIQFLRDIAPVLALALFAIALGVVAAVIKALVFG